MVDIGRNAIVFEGIDYNYIRDKAARKIWWQIRSSFFLFHNVMPCRDVGYTSKDFRDFIPVNVTTGPLHNPYYLLQSGIKCHKLCQ